MSEWIGGNRWLTQAEMEINAKYVWEYFSAKGWTLNAVCGMLGNMQSESHINPAIWQGLNEGDLDGGYGIVQWTPATKFLYWCNDNGKDYTTMPAKLDRIVYEVANNLQFGSTDAYPMTFEQFTKSTEPPYYLAMAFLANYERPAEPYQPWRGEQAGAWFTYLGGLVPTTKKKKSKAYLYGRKRGLFVS